MSKIAEALRGIDQSTGDSEDCWWETSGGAEFGADRLAVCVAIELEKDATIELQAKRIAELDLLLRDVRSLLTERKAEDIDCLGSKPDTNITQGYPIVEAVIHDITQVLNETI